MKFQHLIILTLYFEFFGIYRSKQNSKLEIELESVQK